MAEKGKGEMSSGSGTGTRTRASKRKTEAWPEKGPQESKKQKKNVDFFNKIDTAVDHILSSNETLHVKDYMDLYSSVYDNLVEGSIRFKERAPPPSSHGSGSGKQGCSVDDIYSRLGTLLRRKMKQIAQEGKLLKNEQLLNFYAESFTRFKKHASFIDGIFGYMNRVWVKHINNRRGKNPKTIFIFAMTQWRDTMFKDLIKNVTTAFFTFIQENRKDLSSSQELIKKIVDSYIAMSDLKDDFLPSPAAGASSAASSSSNPAIPSSGQEPKLDVYIDKFETPFLEVSREFYQSLSQEWMAQTNVEGYMKNVEKYLEDETTWASVVLDQSTVPKVSVAVLDEFVRNRVPFLLESFDRLVTTEDFESLKCMYGLLIRLSESSMNSTVPNFRKEMINRGLQAIQNVQQELQQKKIEAKQFPISYVNALAAVCRKHDNIIRECFNNHLEFRKAYDEACVEFINRNAETKMESGEQTQYNLNKTPELLSRYANNFLNANSTIPADDVPNAINNVFLVLKFTESKDSFEKYYNLYLLDRLIKKSSSSEDLEASVISQMKATFGGDYSLKSHQLTQDARVSQDLSREFKTHALETNRVLSWDFQINIFRNGSCKLPLSPPFNIPSELAGRLQDFVQFYSEQKFPSRVLTWYHNKSHGELIYNAGPTLGKKYTLVLSTFQMTVLLMYNKAKSYSYDQIREYTQINEYILNQILPLLEKTKILTRNGTTGNYELFESYKSNKSRMDINIPLRTEVKTDSEVVDEDVQTQRKYVLQAIMVRLMKANQRLRHTELISQTITEASRRFKPNVNTIKRTIEGLIEREYFKRDEKENDLYVYIC